MGGRNETDSTKMLLKEASEHLKNSRFPQAEQLIRQVLQFHPENHEALNMLGCIALNCGHIAQAIEVLTRAIELDDREAEYHCNLGVALLNANQGDKGEDELRISLKLRPNNPIAHLNLGLRALQSGRFEDAKKLLVKATKKMPQNLTALNGLGIANLKCGKPVKAKQQFRAILKLQPDHLEAGVNLAGLLTETGEFDQAIDLYKKLISLHPDKARLNFNLGLALQKSHQELDAIEAYEHALLIDPLLVDAHVNISNILMNRGKLDAAIKHIQAAKSLKPEDVHILINEARLLRISGHSDDAFFACDKILSLEPDNRKAQFIRMATHQDCGNFDQSRMLAQQMLDKNPNDVSVLFSLSTDKNFVHSDPQIECLKEVAKNEQANTDEIVISNFVLGDIYAARHEYSEAFNFYKRGNYLRDIGMNWSDRGENSLFDGLVKTFTKDIFKTPQSVATESARPIFIVGMPRSGSTLVEQILASHPDVVAGGELEFFDDISESLPRMVQGSLSYPNCAVDLDVDTRESLALQYLDCLKEVSKTAARVTDKMPNNYLHLGLIALLFPNARIIYCRRHAMATCFSIYQHDFVGSHPYAYDLKKLGQRYCNHERLMSHWRDVLPMPILEVVYEDLVQDQGNQSRRILDFCDLEWDDRVLNFYETTRAVQTASTWQVRQPIYTSSLANWSNYAEFLNQLKESLDCQ